MTLPFAFATFDDAGLPTGFWQTAAYDAPDEGADRPNCVPAEAVPLLKSQLEAFLNNPGARRWTGTNVVAYAPPPPSPEELRLQQFPNLEPDQFWFVVRASGYEPDLLAWVAEMNDPDSPTYNPVEWAQASAKLDFAKFFERDHPFVEAARVAIGLTSAELDALWAFGAA